MANPAAATTSTTTSAIQSLLTRAATENPFTRWPFDFGWHDHLLAATGGRRFDRDRQLVQYGTGPDCTRDAAVHFFVALRSRRATSGHICHTGVWRQGCSICPSLSDKPGG